MRYHRDNDTIEFAQPVIKKDTKLAMLYVEKDLSGITKAVFDKWETNKADLNHQYLYCTNARISPAEIIKTVEKLTGKKTIYTRLPTTGVADRDIMFELYNQMGMYGTKEIPDPNVLKLGVRLHGIEEFVKERLLPHLGL